MQIYRNLYLDNSIKNKEQILRMLFDRIIIYDLFLICVNKNSQNFFEILEAKEIFKCINKDKTYIIIGMAFGKAAAFEILKQIFQEWISFGNDINNIKFKFLR